MSVSSAYFTKVTATHYITRATYLQHTCNTPTIHLQHTCNKPTTNLQVPIGTRRASAVANANAHESQQDTATHCNTLQLTWNSPVTHLPNICSKPATHLQQPTSSPSVHDVCQQRLICMGHCNTLHHTCNTSSTHPEHTGNTPATANEQPIDTRRASAALNLNESLQHTA